MHFRRILAVLTAGAIAAVGLTLTTPAVAPAHAETIGNQRIIDSAYAEARAQRDAQTREFPLVQARWKPLFVAFTDLTYAEDGFHATMDANGVAYLRTIVQNFADTFKKIGAGVVMEPTVQLVTTPVTIPKENGGRMLHENVLDYLPQKPSRGQYDTIFVSTQDWTTHYGITAPRYYGDDWAFGSGWSYWEMAKPYVTTSYPKNAPGFEYELALNVLLHEFSHQVRYFGRGFAMPEVHSAHSYGFVPDPVNEFGPFYAAILTGRAKEVSTGLNIGMSPKMWSVSPRFLHRPAMATVHYQDELGRPLAPDSNVYGPGGDSYELPTPAAIAGYGKPTLKAGSAPSTGTFTTGDRADIIYVYPRIPVTVTWEGGSTKLVSEALHVRPGAPFTRAPNVGYVYAASEPVTAFTYYDEWVSSTGVARVDTLDGAAFAWDSSGKANVVKDGNTYSLTKASATRVEIAVKLAAPGTRLVVAPLGNRDTANNGTMVRALGLVDVTAKVTGSKEKPTAPRAEAKVTWDDRSVILTPAPVTNDVRAYKAGEKGWGGGGFRSNVPLTKYTYVERVDSIDGVKRIDYFGGKPVTWDSAGTATLTIDSGPGQGRYRLVKKADSSIEVTVTVAAPSLDVVLTSMSYTNTSPTGRVNAAMRLVDVTAQGASAAETKPDAAVIQFTGTWGQYTTGITFSGGETTDLTGARSFTSGNEASWVWGYRTAAPVTAFTYTDRLDANDGGKRLDSLNGTRIVWSASNTATISLDGNTYALVKKSGTEVEVTVTLGTPSTFLRVLAITHTNSTATARLTRIIEVVGVTPQATGAKERLTGAPRAINVFTWGAYTLPVRFSGGQTSDIESTQYVKPGTAPGWVYGYSADVPVSGFTYTERIDGITAARRVDSFNGTPVTWNASGTATIARDGNTYTLVKKSATLIEVTVALGTASTFFRLLAMDDKDTAANASLKRTIQVTSITPKATGTKRELTGTPRGIITILWR